MTQKAIEFGDRVMVNSTEVTEAAGVAGLIGDVYGFTTPSSTGVEVIGVHDDYVLNVHFEELGRNYWFAPGLLVFVDHGAGTTIQIGDGPTQVRTPEGTWEQVPESSEASPVRRFIQKLFGLK